MLTVKRGPRLPTAGGRGCQPRRACGQRCELPSPGLCRQESRVSMVTRHGPRCTRVVQAYLNPFRTRLSVEPSSVLWAIQPSHRQHKLEFKKTTSDEKGFIRRHRQRGSRTEHQAFSLGLALACSGRVPSQPPGGPGLLAMRDADVRPGPHRVPTQDRGRGYCPMEHSQLWSWLPPSTLPLSTQSSRTAQVHLAGGKPNTQLRSQTSSSTTRSAHRFPLSPGFGAAFCTSCS